MKIAQVRARNFRSLRDVTCKFDDVTSLIGPNGSGKSSILRAIDWALNGGKDELTPEDVHQAASPGEEVSVEIEFHGITDHDREILGEKYAPADAERFTVYRTWTPNSEKITAKAFSNPEFEQVRAMEKAADKRAAYNALRVAHPEWPLPSVSAANQIEEHFARWERANPLLLQPSIVSDTNLFGFNSQGRLKEIFDYVFVSADLRTNEEATESKGSTLGRILQYAVDRRILDEAVEKLNADYAKVHSYLQGKYIGDQVKVIEDQINAAVGQYTQGRTIELHSAIPNIRVTGPTLQPVIRSGEVVTSPSHQGHGFQRSLILAALTVLSQSSNPDRNRQLFLAIEEPELYQHPTQARAFASVLQSLATSETHSIQVLYATHSAVFANPTHYHQVRRITWEEAVGESYGSTRVYHATESAIAERLSGFVEPGKIASQFGRVVHRKLSEALFAERVILFEGATDVACLDGLYERSLSHPGVSGCCLVDSECKGDVLFCYAVLKELGIPVVMVVDNDSNYRERGLASGKSEAQIVQSENNHKAQNRKFCRMVNVVEEDYPVMMVHSELFFVPDTLETILRQEIDDWDSIVAKIQLEREDVSGEKNANIYRLAVKSAPKISGCVTEALTTIIRDGKWADRGQQQA